MDIEPNLFYNGNAVHGGNFLEEHNRFGKEAMCRKIETTILLICVLLCGCTRREQLVLGGDASYEASGAADTGSGGQGGEAVNDEPPQAEAAAEEGAQETPQDGTVQDTAQREKASPEEEDGPQVIYVHVCGAVKDPDVYELPAGSRVYEAVQAAGGFAEDADESYVNQAGLLYDGVKLVIPTLEQAQAAGESGQEMIGITGDAVDASGPAAQDPGAADGKSQASDGRININTASEAELCNIPGIGAVRAAAIVAYRQANGEFSSVDEIKNVSGIKEGTYEKIKDSIKIN